MPHVSHFSPHSPSKSTCSLSTSVSSTSQTSIGTYYAPYVRELPQKPVSKCFSRVLISPRLGAAAHLALPTGRHRSRARARRQIHDLFRIMQFFFELFSSPCKASESPSCSARLDLLKNSCLLICWNLCMIFESVWKLHAKFEQRSRMEKCVKTSGENLSESSCYIIAYNKNCIQDNVRNMGILCKDGTEIFWVRCYALTSSAIQLQWEVAWMRHFCGLFALLSSGTLPAKPSTRDKSLLQGCGRASSA